MLLAGTGIAQDPVPPPPSGEAESLGFTGRVGRYFKNRALDATDMLRLRLRAGPGLSLGLRGTDYLSFYAGRHHVGYAGLPGSSYPSMNSSFYGLENQRGVIFFGVNATDTLPNQPQYSPTEFDLGVHLLLAGAEIGVDPVEVGDFLVGFFGVDARGDDIGSPNPVTPIPNRMEGWQILSTVKPETFDGAGQRMEYVRDYFNTGLDTGVQDVDHMFVKEGMRPADEDAVTRFRLGLFAEVEEDDGFSVSFDPDFELEVDLPNLEQRWSVLITREELGELPGTLPSDRDNVTRVGLTRSVKDYHISTDVGVKADIPPEAYAGIQWRRPWTHERWRFVPRIRAYYETGDDGLGQVSSFVATRWLGERRSGVFRSSSAGRISDATDGWEWEQAFTLGYIPKLLDESDRGRSVHHRFIAHGFGVRGSVFGHVDSEKVVDRYRTSFLYRRPFYKDWIYLELGPEFEWNNRDDWDVIPRLRFGFDAIFWHMEPSTRAG